MNPKLKELILQAGYTVADTEVHSPLYQLAESIIQNYPKLVIEKTPQIKESYENVIFLDVDGVLNSSRTRVAFNGVGNAGDTKNWHKVDDVTVRMIRTVSRKANAPIVLSSVWRKLVDIQQFSAYYDLNVIDRTKAINGFRGEEIQEWLSRHLHVKNYAIIDDSNDMFENQMNHFVQTNGDEGFSYKNFLQLCKIFKLESSQINKD